MKSKLIYLVRHVKALKNGSLGNESKIKCIKKGENIAKYIWNKELDYGEKNYLDFIDYDLTSIELMKIVGVHTNKKMKIVGVHTNKKRSIETLNYLEKGLGANLLKVYAKDFDYAFDSRYETWFIEQVELGAYPSTIHCIKNVSPKVFASKNNIKNLEESDDYLKIQNKMLQVLRRYVNTNVDLRIIVGHEPNMSIFTQCVAQLVFDKIGKYGYLENFLLRVEQANIGKYPNVALERRDMQIDIGDRLFK